MVYLRYFITLLVFFSGLCHPVHADKSEHKFYRNFWSPTYHMERLSYCRLDGKQCGMSVSNDYCRMMGYQQCKEQLIDYNVAVTHYLYSPAKCVGWGCHGFMLITCEGKFKPNEFQNYYYRSQRFFYPRFGHYRVDWCYKNGQECGARPANSFCRRMGYRKAEHYKKQENVSATKAIGNHRLCFGPSCNGFDSITCFR
jgi:hypothetical protein